MVLIVCSEEPPEALEGMFKDGVEKADADSSDKFLYHGDKIIYKCYRQHFMQTSWVNPFILHTKFKVTMNYLGLY